MGRLLLVAGALVALACTAAPEGTGTPPICRVGTVVCGDACFDLASSTEHCGRCGNPCPATMICRAGVCRDPGRLCEDGTADCNRDWNDRCETQTVSNMANCGACGVRCRPGHPCVDGQCTPVCPRGRLDCDDRFDTLCETDGTSRENCGACGARCDEPQACIEGVCRCPDGTQFCRNAVTFVVGCRQVLIDPANCGACEIVCHDGPCEGGRCVCPAGQILVLGHCVDRQTSNEHCGALYHPCVLPLRCVGGVCR